MQISIYIIPEKQVQLFKYSYSVQEDDGRINLFWRWRHFLIKYSEITLNQHPLNTVYEWISNSEIKQKNANDLSNYMYILVLFIQLNNSKNTKQNQNNQNWPVVESKN